MKSKTIASLLLAVVLCFGLTACSGEEEANSEGAAEENVVTLTESWDFSDGFYPVVTESSSSDGFGAQYWNRNFYNTLVCYDENGEIEGELAEEWGVSDDGLTYTFTLRDGVSFSDGTPLNADAVKTSLENVITNLGEQNGRYGKLTTIIASMDAPDDHTFVMTLAQPYYAALNDLTMSYLAVVNSTAFNGDPYELCADQTMGTGPYMYAGDSDGTTYTFARNPHYWGDAPEVDSFKVRVIEDNDAKVLALRSGEIDAIIGSTRLSYDAYGELSEDNAYTTAVDDRGNYTRYLGFNVSEAPFDDANVRKAIAYALDKDTLCSAVFRGIEKPADTLLEADKPYCDVEQTSYAFDLDEANESMDEAGWIDGDGDGVREKDGQRLEFTMKYMTEIGALDDAALTIASQLAEIGFDVTLSGSDMSTWYSAMLAGDYEITLYQTYGGVYDPSTLMTNMNSDLNADPVAQQVSSFLVGGNAPILELDSTPDTERVQEIYTEILQTNADQAVLVPVSYTRAFAAWNSDRISGYGFYPDSQYICVADIDME